MYQAWLLFLASCGITIRSGEWWGWRRESLTWTAEKARELIEVNKDFAWIQGKESRLVACQCLQHNVFSSHPTYRVETHSNCKPAFNRDLVHKKIPTSKTKWNLSQWISTTDLNHQASGLEVRRLDLRVFGGSPGTSATWTIGSRHAPRLQPLHQHSWLGRVLCSSLC